MFPACPTPTAAFAPALAFLEGIGAMEMALVAIIGLLLFGGKGLPDMARTFGKAVREFKKATSSVEQEVRRVMNEEPETPPPPRRPRLTPPRPTAQPSSPDAPPPSPDAPPPPSN
jgi:sec-independent protein translocase protein TatA